MKDYRLQNKIKITPLAAESLGVRSMCTLVETPDIKMILDAGISICPYRFYLLPHPIEPAIPCRSSPKCRRVCRADSRPSRSILDRHRSRCIPSWTGQ